MSFLIKNTINNYCVVKYTLPFLFSTRQGHRMRGKPPGIAKTLEQRLEEQNPVDHELNARVNIGFPQIKRSRAEQLKSRLAHIKAQRANPELEKIARSKQLLIDLDLVQEEYNKTKGQYDLRTIAEHYGIFEDLYEYGYFVPRVSLDIKYEIDNGVFSPVYNGNVIKPAEAAKQPFVNFVGDCDPITGKKAKDVLYWTLIATNPDGHFTDSNAEYVHWFVANIPNGDVTKGDTLIDYLPPFPPKGIGYQRFIFVLYKQNNKLDFNAYKLKQNENVDLEKRTFKTLNFYREYQDVITPAGLAFYQTDWDKSITNLYHNVLKMKEPTFEYDFPRPYLSDQKFFPLRQPFNLYMDKHRDIKQLNKEYLEEKLANTHPFDGPKPKLRFPNAHPIRGVPSWLKTEINKKRLGIGRINDY